MITLRVIGVVSNECQSCRTAQEMLTRRFAEHGIYLEFVLVRKEDDEDTYEETCRKFGLNKAPSFYVFGDVYSGLFYPSGKLDRTVASIKAHHEQD